MTRATYNLIDCGQIIRTQIKELSNTMEVDKVEIESDIYDNMDPLQQARKGEPCYWIELARLEE